MIDKEEKLPVMRQCRILDLNRSGVYYKPVPLNEADRELMRQIDERSICSIRFMEVGKFAMRFGKKAMM